MKLKKILLTIIFTISAINCASQKDMLEEDHPIYQAYKDWKTSEIRKLLIAESKKNPNILLKYFYCEQVLATPLLAAIDHSTEPGTIKTILETNPDITKKDTAGRNVIHYVAMMDRYAALPELFAYAQKKLSPEEFAQFLTEKMTSNKNPEYFGKNPIEMSQMLDNFHEVRNCAKLIWQVVFHPKYLKLIIKNGYLPEKPLFNSSFTTQEREALITAIDEIIAEKNAKAKKLEKVSNLPAVLVNLIGQYQEDEKYFDRLVKFRDSQKKTQADQRALEKDKTPDEILADIIKSNNVEELRYFIAKHKDCNYNFTYILKNEYDERYDVKIQTTPLIFAVEQNKTDMVKILLGYPNIDIKAKNSIGHHALYYAVENGNMEIFNLILVYMQQKLSSEDFVKLLVDRPRSFRGYMPKRYEADYLWDVALQLSDDKGNQEEAQRTANYQNLPVVLRPEGYIAITAADILEQWDNQYQMSEILWALIKNPKYSKLFKENGFIPEEK